MKHILKSNGGFSLSRVVKLQNLDEISLDMTIYEVYCILYSNARLYFERVNILFHMKSHLSPPIKVLSGPYQNEGLGV